MASELRLLNAATGSNIYAVVVRSTDEKVWQTTTSTFVTRVNADQANYDIALTETPSGSRIWLGDFPEDITDDGTVLYNVDYYLRATGTPIYTDEILGTEEMHADGSSDTSTPVTANLISIGEYDAAVPDSELTTAAKAFMIAAATAAIENYCHRKLVQIEDHEDVVDGTGAGFVQLDGIPASVSTVTIGYQSDDEEEISGGQFSWTSSGLLYVKPSATDLSSFPVGYQNIKVTYTTSGIVDYALKSACVMVVNAMSRRMDSEILVTEKSVGDIKIKWQAPDVIGDPIFADVRSILEPYVTHFCL